MKSFGALVSSHAALLRIVLALGVPAFATACDPYRTSGIAVAPRPATTSEGVADSTAMADAFAIARRIAVDHRLGGYDLTSDHERQEGFVVCHGYGEVSLCGKVQGREVQFRLWQKGFTLSPRASLLRDELVRALQARFGSDAVRLCGWSTSSVAERSGCFPHSK